LGFGLLGVALAAQARSSYGELLRREVLAPLGMDSTDVELTPALRARLAPGRDERGAPAPHWRFGALEGAGALLSDGADLLRYLRANMGLAKTPLDTALRLVRTPRRDIGGGDRIGLGWMIRSTPDGDVVWHNGETGGYASFVGFTADGRRGVAILANAVGPPQDLGFAALSPRLPVPAAHAAVALAPDALDAYVGRYALAPGFDLDVFRRDAQLFAQASGQSAFPIFASARDAFFARVGGITLDFERGADGAVAALVLHQGGVDRRAARTASTTDARGARSVALDAAVLGDYVGRYVLMPGVAFDVSVRGGQLYAQLTGQAALPVHASAKDRFFYTAVDATLDFERDAAGRVVALVLHQNGRDQRAPRER
ncbi:MAG TPA: serine hydrolase, partial [Dokdonella sp.]